MKRPIVYLTLLLLVQLGLFFALYPGNQNSAEAKNREKLLNFKTAQIDGIELSGDNTTTLTLKKDSGGWRLPEHFAAKADTAKVEELLDTLCGISRPWPVAKTAEAGKRFKVDKQKFERKLVFRSQGKTLATLLLGSSPGFRKVHARIAGEQPIYDIPFSTFQASLKAEDWIDKQQLQVKADEISAIELPDCRLSRHNGKIELDQLADSERTNEDQAQKLLKRLADLQIRNVYGKADQTLPNPVELRVKLSLKDGSSREYGFARGDKSDYELLQVADSPYLFEVNSGFIKELQKFNRGQLAQAKPDSPPAEPENGKTSAGQHPG